MEHEALEVALDTLGALLAERGQSIALLVAGGGSLLLLGVVERPTADVDVVGFPSATGYAKADPLPEFLRSAVREVGDALGLGPEWLNNGPAALVDLGLPAGLAERVTVRRFGGLELHLPARDDLVAFKLYAAADQGVRSKHFADLRALAPTPDQLVAAARWTRTQDPSEPFRGELVGVLAALGVEVSDADV